MRRYFIFLSYDGAAYHGWQRQPNAVSVQQVLEEALSTILRKEIQITGAGRTDQGVHARDMAAHMDLEDECLIDCIQLQDKLNRILPQDISIKEIREVSLDLHARFSATLRRYTYTVTLKKDPFLRDRSLRLFSRPDFDRMNQAAQILLNEEDFTSFSKLHTDVKTNICHLSRAVWQEKEQDVWVFTIEADRFLRNMVRAIVGTLLDVGFHKLTLEAFQEIIKKKDRCAAGTSVPAQGLVLEKVTYPGLE